MTPGAKGSSCLYQGEPVTVAGIYSNGSRWVGAEKRPSLKYHLRRPDGTSFLVTDPAPADFTEAPCAWCGSTVDVTTHRTATRFPDTGPVPVMTLLCDECWNRSEREREWAVSS